MISDKKFFGFDFPPKMESFKPKVKKKYEHHILVSSKDRELPLEEVRRLAHAVLDGDNEATEEFETYFTPVFQLNFKSEKAARSAENTLKEATNNITVEREKKEQPDTTEEGLEKS